LSSASGGMNLAFGRVFWVAESQRASTRTQGWPTYRRMFWNPDSWNFTISGGPVFPSSPWPLIQVNPGVTETPVTTHAVVGAAPKNGLFWLIVARVGSIVTISRVQGSPFSWLAARIQIRYSLSAVAKKVKVA